MPKVVPGYKEQARNRILNEARSVFSEKGYHSATMDDVAKALGVSKGAIYQYFRSKKELFLAALDYHAGVRGSVVQSFLQEGGLKALCTEEFFDRMREESMGSLLLNYDLLRVALSDDTLRKQLRVKHEQWVKGVAEMIQHSLGEKEVSDEVDFLSLARAVLAIRDGLYGSLIVGGDAKKARRAWSVSMTRLLGSVLD
ncbi:MAG: TetR/AcrR family transcriptional regulator [Candidatus Thorarchaeota archaeon]|nr:MAG: TetR/AcrR family transcriptional regulator [Candidatus Thorarchaeota archaeon]